METQPLEVLERISIKLKENKLQQAKLHRPLELSLLQEIVIILHVIHNLLRR